MLRGIQEYFRKDITVERMPMENQASKIIHADLGPCGMDLVDTACGKVMDAGGEDGEGSLTPLLWQPLGSDRSYITCLKCRSQLKEWGYEFAEEAGR